MLEALHGMSYFCSFAGIAVYIHMETECREIVFLI